MRRDGKIGPALWSAALLALLTVSTAGRAGTSRPMRTVTDELGRQVTIPVRLERIVSLAPSVTETLFALGLGNRVVGVTEFCDFPPEARAKASVGMPNTPNLEVLVALQPDIIIGSSTANEIQAVRGIEAMNLPLYGTGDPRTVEDILTSIRSLGELTGTAERARELTRDMERALHTVEEQIAGRAPATALFAIWLDPMIAAGGNTFLGDVLRRAGAEPITADIEDDWPRLSFERVVERDPEVIVFTNAHGLRESFDRLRRQPGWASLRAVRNHRIIWLDESSFRPGPRIVETIADLARQLRAGDPQARVDQP